jgi:hypothetical protein
MVVVVIPAVPEVQETTAMAAVAEMVVPQMSAAEEEAVPVDIVAMEELVAHLHQQPDRPVQVEEVAEDQEDLVREQALVAAVAVE